MHSPFYYRISPLRIYIPPFREKNDKDKENFIYYFIFKKSHKIGIKKEISLEAMEYLKRYHFSGNIRELKAVIERAVILSKEPIINVEDLPEEILNPIKVSFLEGSSPSIIKEILLRMEKGESFWTTVRKPYLQRELNKYQLKEILHHGLKASRGSFKALLPYFHIEERDYKKFMDFLRHQGIKIETLGRESKKRRKIEFIFD
ncbi:MAG: hypothetical protein AB1410_02655 [Acidobacteriota bacterium]